jgi:translation initiation factor 1
LGKMTGMFAGTEWDREPHCVRCDQPESACACPPEPTPAKTFKEPGKQTARLRVEKRAKGKLVTVVAGLKADETDLPALLVRLKNSCGAGGSLADENLELQGDHRARIETLRGEAGYKVKGGG